MASSFLFTTVTATMWMMIASLSSTTEAFSLTYFASHSWPQTQQLAGRPIPSGATTIATRLGMAEDTEQASASADGENEEASSSDDDDKPPEEDPEVTALKAEIKELESTLAGKKLSLEKALDECEEYSKTGYARKVAEMENMRRVRSNIASSSQASAIAGVLRDFLPAYDTLNDLKEKYANDEFGSKYSELHLKQTFQDLGVTDYTVEAGDVVNNFRMKVLEKEVNKDFAKDTVIRQVSSGLELDGNVIRAASCVASLGSEEDTDGEGTESAEGEE